MMTKSAKNRRAVSLIEAIVGLTASSIILTTSATVLHRVMQADSSARAFAGVEQNAMRFARQLRQDIHQASAVTIDQSKPAGGVFLKLELPNDHSIEYIRAGRNLSRTALQNGKITARDDFAFSETAELTIAEAGTPKRVILSLSTPRPANNANQEISAIKSSPLSMQIEAAVGRDLPGPSSSRTESRSQ